MNIDCHPNVAAGFIRQAGHAAATLVDIGDAVAGHALVDDVIDPADTRAAIIAGLNANRNKQVFRPWRKHGVMPV